MSQDRAERYSIITGIKYGIKSILSIPSSRDAKIVQVPNIYNDKKGSFR